MIAASKIVFVEADGGDFGISVSDATKTAIINDGFTFVDQIVSQDGTFVVGAFSGRFLSETITNSLNMFSGSFKVFIDDNAVIVVFDAGIFQAVI